MAEAVLAVTQQRQRLVLQTQAVVVAEGVTAEAQSLAAQAAQV
jgi:hypothetical protein